MSFVGLDPDCAGELAGHLGEAARELSARAEAVTALLAQAGISSSLAPAELRDVAAWAEYRSRDLRRRIDGAIAADHAGAGPRVPGFRFVSEKGAVHAADGAADRLRELVGKHDKKGLANEVRGIEAYLADPRFTAELFKRLGPKGTFDLLNALRGTTDIRIVGHALAAAQDSGAIPSRFVERLVEEALKKDAALDAYVHPWGSVDARDQLKVALEEWRQSSVGPPGLHKFMEAIAPLVPYLESGAKVAVVGGAVVILTAAGACVALSEGSCLGPTAAFVEEGIVVFSSESPSVPTGLFETLPVSMQDETKFGSFIDSIHARLSQLVGGGIRGSSATGVTWKTGEPFSEESDIDLAIVDNGLWGRAQELGYELIGGGTRTWPLDEHQLDRLGLRELQAELTEIAGHDVSIMLYRSMDDILARGPFIVIPPS